MQRQYRFLGVGFFPATEFHNVLLPILVQMKETRFLAHNFGIAHIENTCIVLNFYFFTGHNGHSKTSTSSWPPFDSAAYCCSPVGCSQSPIQSFVLFVFTIVFRRTKWRSRSIDGYSQQGGQNQKQRQGRRCEQAVHLARVGQTCHGHACRSLSGRSANHCSHSRLNYSEIVFLVENVA